MDARLFKYRSWYDGGGALCWAVLFIVTLVLGFMNPDLRSVVPNYRHASEAFLTGGGLYDLDIEMGYLYAPAFAVAYIPFFELGPYFGDLLWRSVACGVLTYAAFRQSRLIDDSRYLWLLSCGLFLAAPLTAGSLRNGQATILLAGACWLLTLAALERKPLHTLGWATLALIAKPTAIIMLLLVGALRPRQIPMLVLAVLIVLALPYGFAPHEYVTELYRSFITLMSSMSLDKTSHFTPADFTAPLSALDIAISTNVATGIRAIAGLLTLAVVLWFDRNIEKGTAGLAIFATAAFYMCVFNPRVEGNTYALLAVPFGLSIALMLRREGAAILPIALAVMFFLAGFSGVVSQLHRLINLWFQPVICTPIFLGIAWWFWARARAPRAGTATMGAHASA
jgi:hypothetical protein